MGLKTLENIIFRLAMCQIIGIDTLPASILKNLVILIYLTPIATPSATRVETPIARPIATADATVAILENYPFWELTVLINR